MVLADGTLHSHFGPDLTHSSTLLHEVMLPLGSPAIWSHMTEMVNGRQMLVLSLGCNSISRGVVFRADVVDSPAPPQLSLWSMKSA